MLPFTAEVLFSSIEAYNQAIWPAPLVGPLLGLIALRLVMRPVPGTTRIVGAILVAAWLWTGIAFHLIHFSTINFASPAYALVFVVQAALLVWASLVRGRVGFGYAGDVPAKAGFALAVFALAVWPLAGPLFGGGFASAPWFGVEPTATVLFTLAMLLLAVRPPPLWLAALPALWTFVDGATYFVLGMPEGLIMPVLGTGAFFLIALKHRRAGG